MPRTNVDQATGLTEQQRLFADEYLTDFDAVAAYQRAGYRAKGRAADAAASRLLNAPAVQAYMRNRMARISAKLELTTEDVLRELKAVAFFDPRKLLTGGGGIKRVEDWDSASAAAVQSLEVFEEFQGRGDERETVGYTKKVKLHPKVAALEKLGQHLGLFAKKLEHSGPGGKPIQHAHDYSDLLSAAEGSDTGIGPARGRAQSGRT